MDILKAINYQILIGPYIYNVSYRKDLKSLSEAMGMTDSDTQIILIDSALQESPDRLATTLWHEIKHAVYDLASMGPNVSDENNPSYEEEEAVSRTATLEVDVLRRNPMLTSFLLGIYRG